MDKQSGQLEDAWRILEHHWKIQPRSGGISYTPGYSILRFIFSPIIRGIARIKATGSEHIPGRGATILAANHLSHVDPILVIASSRRKVHYLAKDAHFKNFFLRLFMNSTGQIETHREEGGDDALASAADVLAANSALGIFPEGTRTKINENGRINTGVFAIHKILKIPILVIKHNAGRYWQNKKFVKKPGTINNKDANAIVAPDINS